MVLSRHQHWTRTPLWAGSSGLTRGGTAVGARPVLTGQTQEVRRAHQARRTGCLLSLAPLRYKQLIPQWLVLIAALWTLLALIPVLETNCSLHGHFCQVFCMHGISVMSCSYSSHPLSTTDPSKPRASPPPPRLVFDSIINQTEEVRIVER